MENQILREYLLYHFPIHLQLYHLNVSLLITKVCIFLPTVFFKFVRKTLKTSLSLKISERNDGAACHEKQRDEGYRTGCCITRVLGAVTFLPVNTIFANAPVTDPCNSCTGDGGASSNHLSPPPIPLNIVD